MMNILGVNAFHGDASACLIREGKLIAAAEEERFRRIKHCAGFPSKSIQYCLAEAGINISEVAHLAVNQDVKANRWQKMRFVLTHQPPLDLLIDRLKNKQSHFSITKHLHQYVGAGFRGKIHRIEHHLAHLASSFYVSAFESAVLLSVDGFGDFASTAWGEGQGKDIAIEGKVYFPHSLGIFYQALTQWLGFLNYGDEYKVMGLAPYGQPKLMSKMRSILKLQEKGLFELNLDFFRHHKEKIMYEWEKGAPKIGIAYTQALSDLLGPARQNGETLTQYHKDVARSVQAMYEEAFFHLLNHLYKKYRHLTLCLAGGCHEFCG